MSTYTPPKDYIPAGQTFDQVSQADKQSNQLITKDRTDLEVFEEVVDAYVDKDFDLVRNNLMNLIEGSEDIFKQLAMLQKASDHPRAYEVLANMMKTIQDINKDLLDLHKKKKEINQQDPSSMQSAGVINNNQYVFTGTPSELIQQRKREQQNEG